LLRRFFQKPCEILIATTRSTRKGFPSSPSPQRVAAFQICVGAAPCGFELCAQPGGLTKNAGLRPAPAAGGRWCNGLAGFAGLISDGLWLALLQSSLAPRSCRNQLVASSMGLLATIQTPSCCTEMPKRLRVRSFRIGQVKHLRRRERELDDLLAREELESAGIYFAWNKSRYGEIPQLISVKLK